MLLIKLRNSAELFWDSLDDEEKRMVAYALAWLLVSVFAAIRKAQREAFKREVLTDVITAQVVVADARES